ncbi:hypothetical protein GGI18_004409, partial [Coemansia linderi]
SALSVASGAVENGAQSLAPPSPRWAISENSSAIAGWPVEIVERFDVRFDELVSATKRVSSSPVAVSIPSDAELTAGEYTFYPALHEEALSSLSEPGTAELPALSLQSSSSPASSEHQRSGDNAGRGHHRRTSSGLVGFLMRGFRSSSSATVPCVAPPVTPPQAEALRTDGRRRLHHVRSVSSVVHGSKDAPHIIAIASDDNNTVAVPATIVLPPLLFLLEEDDGSETESVDDFWLPVNADGSWPVVSVMKLIK